MAKFTSHVLISLFLVLSICHPFANCVFIRWNILSVFAYSSSPASAAAATMPEKTPMPTPTPEEEGEEGEEEARSPVTAAIMAWLSRLSHPSSAPQVVEIDHENVNKTIATILAAKEKASVYGMAFVYPGTKWCGNGNLATSDDDLGVATATDECCRAHDQCPVSVHGGESKDGITNFGPFTLSHCDCELNFYKCLNKLNSSSALMVKFSYFTMLRSDCLKYEYPKICLRRAPVLWNADFSNRCLRWRIFTSYPKRLITIKQKAPSVPYSELYSSWSGY